MKIISKKLSEIKIYKNNPRNNDEAVEYVKNSIEEFGFKVPIVIDNKNVIICGHTRYKAAQQLGLEEVPCICADDLTSGQVKAFRLADNKVSEKATWDEDKLMDEINNVLDIDLSQFGFEDLDIDKEEIIEPEEQELKPYKKVHYLITADINDNDKIIDTIKHLEKVEGVEIASTLNSYR